MTAPWIDVVSIAAALLVVLVPGALVAAAARLAGVWWFAAAGSFSVAIVGITGVVSAWVGAPFGLGGVGIVTLALAAAASGLTRIPRAARPGSLLGAWDRETLWTGAAIVVGAIATTVPVIAAMGSLETVSQSYDGVFHLNAVAYVLDTGDASSFHLYRVTHPGDDVEFYPAAWHALTALVAQLTGASIPVAMNAVWIATSALVWVPGAALFTAVAVPARGAAAVGAVLASAFAAFPPLLLSWGTLYPTGLAYMGIPFGLAVLVALLDARMRAGVLVPLAIAAAGWFAAEVFSHPRSLPSVAVLALPLLAVAAWRLIARVWAEPRRRRLVVGVLSASVLALVAVGVAGWIYVWRTYDVANRPISDHLNGGPATAKQTIPEAVAQALTLSPAHAFEMLPAVLLAAAVLFGAVVAVRSGRGWLAVAWVLVVVLFALASGSNSDLAKLATGIWYKDQFRLFALLPIVGVPLATGAVMEVARRIGGRFGTRAALPAAAVATALLAATSWASPASAGVRADIGAVFATPPAGAPAMIDAEEYAFLTGIAEYVPEGEIVAGNPWNGSALVWALGGREALFPHFTGEWSADEFLVAAALDRAGDDPEVCAAVDRLGLHYVLTDLSLLWGDPAEAALYSGIDRAAGSGVLSEVARSGDTALSRITAC